MDSCEFAPSTVHCKRDRFDHVNRVTARRTRRRFDVHCSSLLCRERSQPGLSVADRDLTRQKRGGGRGNTLIVGALVKQPGKAHPTRRGPTQKQKTKTCTMFGGVFARAVWGNAQRMQQFRWRNCANRSTKHHNMRRHRWRNCAFTVLPVNGWLSLACARSRVFCSALFARGSVFRSALFRRGLGLCSAGFRVQTFWNKFVPCNLKSGIFVPLESG